MGPYAMPAVGGEGGGMGGSEWMLPVLAGLAVGAGSLSDKRNVQPGSGMNNAMMLPMLMSMMQKRKQGQAGPGADAYGGGTPQGNTTFPDYSHPVAAQPGQSSYQPPQSQFQGVMRESPYEQMANTMNRNFGQYGPASF